MTAHKHILLDVLVGVGVELVELFGDVGADVAVALLDGLGRLQGLLGRDADLALSQQTLNLQFDGEGQFGDYEFFIFGILNRFATFVWDTSRPHLLKSGGRFNRRFGRSPR